jgi:hypothetical protein
MLSLAVADPGGSEIAPLAQIRWAPTHIVSIRGKNADLSLIQHSLGPISRISAEGAREGARRDLHPDPGPGHSQNGVVMGTDPGQALGVGQYRHVAGRQQAEEELLHPRRRHVVGRLDQDIARVGQRHETAGLQAFDEVEHNVIVRSDHQLQRDALRIKDVLQLRNGHADLRTTIMVNTGKDVGRASDVRHAVRDEGLCHRQRDGLIGGAIVDTRQNVAMKVDHGLSDLASNEFKHVRPGREQGQRVNRMTSCTLTFLPHVRANRELHPLHVLIHYG